jgi:hypothetical protein
MPGGLVFAWQSPTWGGGIAFHEVDGEGADAAGEVLANAYLLTHRQLVDVLEQEMWRSPGADHDLAPLLSSGRHEIGPGRYETLRVVGALAGCRSLGLRAPAPAYLATIVRGLRAAHGLPDPEISAYLARSAGMRPGWTLPAV